MRPAWQDHIGESVALDRGGCGLRSPVQIVQAGEPDDNAQAASDGSQTRMSPVGGLSGEPIVMRCHKSRFRPPWTRIPDEEYVAKLRKGIAWWDRWRFWFIAFHAGLLVGVTWVIAKAISLVIRLAQPANAPFALIGFVTGAMIGFSCGWVVYGILHGLISALGGFRAERLLLRCLDAHDSLQYYLDRQPKEESDATKRSADV